MQDLLQIEQIKQLKARYFRCLDTNDWEQLAATLAPDCVSSYGNGRYSFSGREAIIKFLSDSMSGPDFLSMHHGHNPEIELTGPTTARGHWYLQDIVILAAHKQRLYGAGIYHDEYVKLDGQWLHSRIGYERTFECMEPLPEGHRITHNMWQP